MHCQIFTTVSLRKVNELQVSSLILLPSLKYLTQAILILKLNLNVDLDDKISAIDLSPLQKGIETLNGTIVSHQSSLDGTESFSF